MTHPVSYSLRRRLAWLLTGSLAAIWLLSALVVYQRTHDETDVQAIIRGKAETAADTQTRNHLADLRDQIAVILGPRGVSR